MEIDIPVELGPRSYLVRVVSGGSAEAFGTFVRAALDRTWAGRSSRIAFLVADENTAALSRDAEAGLHAAGLETVRATVPPGESSKDLATLSRLYDELVQARADRHTVVVAVGGGVIGDLAGFAAATFARGIPLVMVPTSLLAQVDSSVGGKVGINHPRAKNILGAFHQPAGVWIDTAHLASLPARELRCGLAEVVKYGVILDAPFFAELEANVGPILRLEHAQVRRIVARSCELKALVVREDEREETGLRAVLNFGHTIGHAIEAVAGYGGRYLHGEAVAVGMAAECLLAERLGWISAATTARVVGLLTAFGLPTVAPGLDPDGLVDAMQRDKKNQRGRVRFVLPRELGRVELTGEATEADVRAVLESTCRTTATP